MSHYPGVRRPAVELVWKTGNYCVGAIRRGYIRGIPFDVARFLAFGVSAWANQPKIKPETLHLVDYLRSNMVCDAAEYAAIDTSRSHFAHFARRRLTLTKSPRQKAA